MSDDAVRFLVDVLGIGPVSAGSDVVCVSSIEGSSTSSPDFDVLGIGSALFMRFIISGPMSVVDVSAISRGATDNSTDIPAGVFSEIATTFVFSPSVAVVDLTGRRLSGLFIEEESFKTWDSFSPIVFFVSFIATDLSYALRISLNSAF